ncbi:MAG: APA family basic amino acid/polyamine antiporter [Candidatus Promineifilaceae bacterium]|jgi:basic amino acid/polyamine antiporter, APA family
MSGDTKVASELSRELSLFQITMMGLGMMIGAGVFLGMGTSIGYAGPGGVVLTFALNGLVAIFTAMSYAELSSAIPRAGGAYNFARVGFGRGTSFVAGWMEWFASSVAGALYAVCFSTYILRFLTGLGFVNIPENWYSAAVRLLAITVAAVFLYINYRGASETGKIGAIMTLAQTLFLIFIAGLGVWTAIKDPERLANFEPFLNADNHGWGALLVTMGLTAVAFEGYEVIAQAGDETIDPRRNIPKAMLLSVLIVTLTYVGCAFATVVAVQAGPDLIVDGQVVAPWQWIGSHGGEGFGAAIERLMPRCGNVLVVLAVIFASTSALNATIYSATRASYALGRDRMLPPFFAAISNKTKTPWVALLFTGGIIAIVAGALDTMAVAASASVMFLLLFFLVNICVIRVRYRMGDELQYGFLMPFFPLFPILAIICQGALTVFLHEIGLAAIIIAPCWIIIGAIFYRVYSKSRATSSGDEIHVLEEEHVVVGDEYRVMVAVSNPDTALSLVASTHAICEAKKASVEVLHMVPVPDQVPLSDAHKYMSSGKEAITETMLYLAPSFQFGTTVRYCRNVARGIVSAVRERKSNLLIMGWRGGSNSRGFTLSSTIDPVIERCCCDVAVFKNCGGSRYKRVLVPVAGGPNSALALELAIILADQQEGEVTVFTVGSANGQPAFDVEKFARDHAPPESSGSVQVKTRTVMGNDPVESIIGEASSSGSDYDLMVLGGTREPVLAQFTRGSVSEKIAQLYEKPMVMVQMSRGLRSWIRRCI